MEKTVSHTILWKRKNPVAALAVRRRARKRINARSKEIINRHKMKPCMDCKIQYSPWVMEYDHRDPIDKKFVIGSARAMSVSKLLNEINKCDVVCANCHKERTHKLRQSRTCWQDIRSAK